MNRTIAKIKRMNKQTKKKNMQKNTNRILQIFGGNNNTHQSNWSKMKHIFICRFFLWFCQSVSYFFVLFRWFTFDKIDMIWNSRFCCIQQSVVIVVVMQLSFWDSLPWASNNRMYNLLLLDIGACVLLFFFHWFRWNSNTESYKSIQTVGITSSVDMVENCQCRTGWAIERG